MRKNTLSHRIAIVTGASRQRGIGAAICRALAADGVDIFFTYWRPYDRSMPWGAEEDEPIHLRDELLRMGVRCESAEIDLSASNSSMQIMEEVETRLGQTSILINNATHSTSDEYEHLDAETLDAHYTVNVRGTILLSIEFARRYQGGAGGRIINLVSGQSINPMPTELAYAATKGAIEAFTFSLAAALASHGIMVNAVDPGGTDTGWMSEDLKRDLLVRSPHGRIGQPEDAARLVAFLASDAAGWITGQVMHSDGGLRR